LYIDAQFSKNADVNKGILLKESGTVSMVAAIIIAPSDNDPIRRIREEAPRSLFEIDDIP
jgi:hypothetical protein